MKRRTPGRGWVELVPPRCGVGQREEGEMDLSKRRAELVEQLQKAGAEMNRIRELALRIQGAIAVIDEQLAADKADESEG